MMTGPVSLRSYDAVRNNMSPNPEHVLGTPEIGFVSFVGLAIASFFVMGISATRGSIEDDDFFK
jgi:hypothetical protein